MTDIFANAKLILPRVPLLFKTGLSQSLGTTEESSKWDVKTAITINLLRSIMGESSSTLTRQQKFSLKDPGVKGQMWAVPTALSVDTSEDDLRQLLFTSIDELKETGQETYDTCALQSVEAEWTAHRPGVSNDAPPPSNLSNSQLFSKLNADVKLDGTILYFHGGAHYLCDPSSHRKPVSQLCKAAGQCRALSLRYRLSPQNPFPSALLDCLVSYVSLLYPREGSLHQAIKPEKIVLAGDSAGGNLCMALLALLMHIRQVHPPDSGKTFKFNGIDVPLPLPLPAGVATNASWNDATRSSPSLITNWRWDYLPYPSVSLTATPASAAPTSTPDPNPPQEYAKGEYNITSSPAPNARKHQPGETLNPYPCDAWPALPPRAEIYCTGEILCHPLVSPLYYTADQWRGSCPLFFECGEEMLADEVRAVARRAASVGVPVKWVGFEAMPHCFAQVLPGTEAAKKGIAAWGSWIGNTLAGKEPETGGTWVKAKTFQEETVDLQSLNGDLSDAEMFARMRSQRERRIEAYRSLVEREGKGKANGDARL